MNLKKVFKMNWNSFSKAVARMSGSRRSTFWYNSGKNRANRWISQNDNSAKIILEHFTEMKQNYPREHNLLKQASYYAISFIWEGELLTPKDWDDEKTANLTGKFGDPFLIGVETPSLSSTNQTDDQKEARRKKIKTVYISSLFEYDQGYSFYLLLDAIHRKLKDHHTYPSYFIDIFEELTSGNKKFCEFFNNTLKETTLSSRIENYKDYTSYISELKRLIEVNLNWMKGIQVDNTSRQLCGQGLHNWVSPGVTVYYQNGIAYKSESIKERVCSRCGKKENSI